MPVIRPDLQSTYNSLCATGEQFPEPRESMQLEELTFVHPRKGEVPIKIDAELLAAQGTVYVGDIALRAALQNYGIEASSWPEATKFLRHHLQSQKLVWGFSGYATGGYHPETSEPLSYTQEAEGLAVLYDYLSAENCLPSLTQNGGVNQGFLALESVMAQSVGIPTVGFIPRQGLASVGIHEHLIVAGDTYEDREALVATADVVVCAGGFKGTIRECIRAVNNGAAVLLLALKDYPDNSLPNAYHMYGDLQRAEHKGQLVVCKSLEKVPESVDRILQVDVRSSRTVRVGIITDFLVN